MRNVLPEIKKRQEQTQKEAEEKKRQDEWWEKGRPERERQEKERANTRFRNKAAVWIGSIILCGVIGGAINAVFILPGVIGGFFIGAFTVKIMEDFE